MRNRILISGLAAASLFALTMLTAAPASADNGFFWQVYWNSQPSSLTAAPQLSGRASYLRSGSDTVATITVVSNLGDHQSACVTRPTIILTHTGNADTGLSNGGVFSNVDPGLRCNGTYHVELTARQRFAGAYPNSPEKLDFTYSHPAAATGAPGVKASADGRSLLVSWPAPANVTPDLVGYQITRTYKPTADAAPQVSTVEVGPDATTSSYQIGDKYGGYQFTVKARYWGTGGPGSPEVLSAASPVVQATVAAPATGGDTTTPGTGAIPAGGGGGAGGGGAGSGGTTPPTSGGAGNGGGPNTNGDGTSGGTGGTGATPVINTDPGAATGFFTNTSPRTERPDVSAPRTVDSTVPGLSSNVTEVPQVKNYAIPEPGGPEAVKPKTPLSATAMVDHTTGGGLNGRTIATVVASVLVLGLIAAQLAFLGRRAAALELPTDDSDPPLV